MDREMLIKSIQSEFSHGTDVLLYWFLSAFTSSRRHTLCNPFPPMCIRHTTPDHDKLKIMVHELMGHYHSIETLPTLSMDHLKFIYWIVHEGHYNWELHQVDPTEITCITDLDIQTPRYAYQRVPSTPAPIPSGCLWAFHGSLSENWHAIVHHGLYNMSDTRHMNTGNIYGDGVYLTTDCTVAQSFSHSRAISNEALNTKFGCIQWIALCSVRDDKGNVKKHGNYLVAPSETVTIQYLLGYGISTSKPNRFNMGIVLVLYVLLLFAISYTRS